MDVVVDPNKILRYLLVDEDKGSFFRRLGYSDDNWEQLRSDLFALAVNGSKRLRQITVYGEDYEIIGIVLAPNGRNATIQSG